MTDFRLQVNQGGFAAINPKFTKLVTSLCTAVEKGGESQDKEMTSYDDCFDSFRLSLIFWSNVLDLVKYLIANRQCRILPQGSNDICISLPR
jgi:hypothetical protein